MAVDSSYPLLPITNLLCAALLFVLLVINFLRRSQAFNLAVNILSACLFLDTLTKGVNMIVWANDNHLTFPFIYCDIVSHTQMFTFVAKPACTLLITRQLYQIVSMTSIDGPSLRHNVIFELAFGLGLPAFVTGVLYYIVQPNRFAIAKGFGCLDVVSNTGYTWMFIYSWTVVFPLFSVVVYCPRIVVFLMHLRRLRINVLEAGSLETSSVRSNDEGIRLLMLVCFDLFLSLPIAAANYGFKIWSAIDLGDAFTFDPGWTRVHENWAPVLVKFDLDDRIGFLIDYSSVVSSILVGYAVFALFGCTPQARTMYARFFWAIVRCCRRRKPERRRSVALPAMRFEASILESITVSIEVPVTITAIPRAAIFNFDHRSDIARV
ncbi:unnamed protein product [Peniophora sp. CBMAI 1063]|nr:unnamed protein product [Peniophora sp. CBMAI 1063]